MVGKMTARLQRLISPRITISRCVLMVDYLILLIWELAIVDVVLLLLLHELHLL